jgi:hypothetical protein
MDTRPTVSALEAQLRDAHERVAACRRRHDAAVAVSNSAVAALAQAAEEDEKARLALAKATQAATEAQREVLRTNLVAAAAQQFAEEVGKGAAGGVSGV